jgi:murein L,D-transpeptidase YafK
VVVARAFLVIGLIGLFLASSAGPLAAEVEKVLILKSKRTMLLIGDGEIVRAYRVALGRNPVGPKRLEGDKRTPEGLYFVEAKNPKSQFHLGLKISYPNERDMEEATKMGVKPGGMIMIHGLAKGMERLGLQHRNTDWTDGCIAVTNKEIEEIWSLVKEGTPVEIRP